MGIPPFVCVEGRPYLVVNFDLEPKTLDLRDQFEALLRTHPQEVVLLLRPISPPRCRFFNKPGSTAMWRLGPSSWRWRRTGYGPGR